MDSDSKPTTSKTEATRQISRKRGPKPRSQRNRKRARSERQETPVSFQTNVQPLQLDGESILSVSQQPTWIRTVEPYPYTFTTYAKARWIGRTILDVYATEFGSYPKSYYESAILQGRILVSDKNVSLDYIVKGGDVLTHTVHRHEPGVAVASSSAPYVNIVQNTDQILAVDKPGTLPVHACGGYHIQSLMNLLEADFGKLYTIHRLDRLTSGLVLLGKTSAVAQEWGKAIMQRDCQKYYLARVQGRFPLETDVPRLQESVLPVVNGEFTCHETEQDAKENARTRNAFGYWITGHSGDFQSTSNFQDVHGTRRSAEDLLSTEDAKGDTSWLHLACPTRVANHKDGVCEAGAFGDLPDDVYTTTVKPAQTSFAVISYDESSDSTLVLCRPTTGRTHQIRLHLQKLGHPIANDPNYGGDIWYGNAQGQVASRVAQERLDAMAAAPSTSAETSEVATATIDVPATEDEIEKVSNTFQGKEESIHEFIRRTCVWCARSNRQCEGTTSRDTLEFLIRSPGIWLHALQYKFDNASGDDQVFRAPMPTWANCGVVSQPK
eukprot:Nitzschia sp. Nitz4//scaffold189_size62959//41492//43147//NITZ4_006313-RA/size62959-processed-gene-0.24-mRNA-1//1//CDS//3329539911//6587//frame0